MDIQVQELIDKIKKDGIETATAEADKIRQGAEAEAARLLDAARKEAAEIVGKAAEDAGRSEKAGVAALEQASRNLLLVFRDEVQALLDRLVREQVKESLNDDVLKKAIPEVLGAWGPKEQGSLDVLLSPASLSKVEAFFNTKLSAALKKGLTLGEDSGLAGGFRIANRDGSAYYDFSADSVAGMFCAYLNPRLAEILRASSKDR